MYLCEISGILQGYKILLFLHLKATLDHELQYIFSVLQLNVVNRVQCE